MTWWIIILFGIIIFNIGFVIGAWWRANFADEPIPADSTYGRNLPIEPVKGKVENYLLNQ